MDANTRAATAAIIRIIKKGRIIDKIEDRGRSKKISLSGTYSSSAIDIYDHSRNCHINASISGHNISIHDHGTSKRITLELSGNSFHGYDSGSSKPFSGQVSDSNVTIDDFEDGKHHNYS